MKFVSLLRKIRAETIPNISARKLSLTGPSTGRDDENRIRCEGMDEVIAHAAVILDSVELPSLMTCTDGSVRRCISLGRGIG